MKLYQITVTDRKTKKVIDNAQERSNHKKLLENKYKLKYRFHDNMVTIKIDRMTRSVGVQIDLIDVINEISSE